MTTHAHRASAAPFRAFTAPRREIVWGFLKALDGEMPSRTTAVGWLALLWCQLASVGADYRLSTHMVTFIILAARRGALGLRCTGCVRVYYGIGRVGGLGVTDTTSQGLCSLSFSYSSAVSLMAASFDEPLVSDPVLCALNIPKRRCVHFDVSVAHATDLGHQSRKYSLLNPLRHGTSIR